MPLTPMEIHNKDFMKKFRGYDPDEVDQFLDIIVEDYEMLYKENIDLKENFKTAKEKLDTYRSIENTLKDTLVTAQRTAEEVIANAHKKAEMILKESEDAVSKQVKYESDKLNEVKTELESAQQQLETFKIRFKKLLEAELELLLGKNMMSETQP